MKKLLNEDPSAAFKEITEEIRYLRLVDLNTLEDETDPSNEATNDFQIRRFSMHVEKIRWNPVEKGRDSKNPKVRIAIVILIGYVEHLVF